MERREPIPFPFLLFLCQPLICLDRCLPSLWCLLFSGPLFHFLSLSDIGCCLSHLSKAAHRPTCMHTFTVCAFGCHRCLTLRSLYSVKVVENGNRDESSARHSGPGSTSGMFLTLTHTHTHTHPPSAYHKDTQELINIWGMINDCWWEELLENSDFQGSQVMTKSCPQCYNTLLTSHCSAHLFRKYKDLWH